MPKPKPVRRRAWNASSVDTYSRESNTRRDDGTSASLIRNVDNCFEAIEPNALVISPYGVLAFVFFEGAEYVCRVDDRLVDSKRAVLAPGDAVRVERTGDALFVTAVRHRRTKLSRPAVGHTRERVIAANIDHVVIVAAVAKPAFSPGLIDRYLIAAQVGGAEPIICLNKIDLAKSDASPASLYRDFGLRVIGTSCKTGEGIGELKNVLAGKLSVLCGHSGVGKSSLINALEPTLDLDTQTISESTQKGRHTTTTARLYELASGARIIDTPGIRQLGLWGVSPAEVDYYFHEFAEIAPECRFRDCTHIHEPNCAVKAAVECGTVSKGRYESYLRIRQSLIT